MKSTLTKTDKILLLSSLLCALLITTRILFTGRITFIFLIWNLFLAGIPYLTSRLIEIKQQRSSFNLILAVLFWLPFFPNSPYILTDFVHLSISNSNLFWVDVSLITIFSLTGLMYGIYSLRIMHSIIKEHINLKIANIFFYASIFLAGFGIYIGRVLRWNSWDIIASPYGVISDLLEIFLNPIDHYQAWIVSLGFSLVIFISANLLNPVKSND